MAHNIPFRVYQDILAFAQKNHIEKVILFGSRARGTNCEKSDIDIAVSGGNYADFCWDIQESARTLLMFDIVALDTGISAELQNEIEKDGIVIYEKI